MHEIPELEIGDVDWLYGRINGRWYSKNCIGGDSFVVFTVNAATSAGVTDPHSHLDLANVPEFNTLRTINVHLHIVHTPVHTYFRINDSAAYNWKDSKQEAKFNQI